MICFFRGSTAQARQRQLLIVPLADLGGAAKGNFRSRDMPMRREVILYKRKCQHIPVSNNIQKSVEISAQI